jgi:LuxR family transcriptional regulator, maltose regulon positive regulatory protein
MTDNLLQTKLHVPLLRSSLVPRPRLTDKLNAGLDGKLILISAQAGSGKTTLVTEWLSAIENCKPKIANQVAWLSLDENDNDPSRFLAYLFSALRQVDTRIGQTVEAMLQSPQPPPDVAVLTALVNEITAVPQPFILILDDYHVIHAPSIYEQLNFLIEHQPPQMRMVIITREDPLLPLPRLRARGQLTEIRQSDLRFSPEECADFLQHVMRLNVSSEDVLALERRTEGWIAGLQLAAVSMQGRDDLTGYVQAFTGSNRFVLDYLMEEVFNRQTPAVKDFLLKTSILERLSAQLCDAVLEKMDSQHTLEMLEQANLFIVPLDQSRVWYRYHRLFAELLRQRLQITEGISVNTLHRLSSQWFAKEEFFPEAIQHALAGADWDQAANLIGRQSVDMFRRGELTTLLGWLKSLPDEVIRARPALCGDYGWALTLTGQFESAAPLLDCAEQASRNDKEQLGQVMIAQAYLARSCGDYPRAIALSRQALELIAETDILQRGLIMFTLGSALLGVGQFAEAESVLVEASEYTRASGNDYARQTVLGMLGGIQKMQGRLYRGAEFCRRALQESHGAPTAAQTQIFLATILYEWNDLDAAEEQLTQALKASEFIGNLTIQPEIFRLMAHIKQARGEPAAVSEFLNRLNELSQGTEVPIVRAMFAALRADLALIQGDIASAAHWAGQMTEGIDPAALGTTVGMMQAHLSLAQGKQAEAGNILAGVYEAVAAMGLNANMIEVRALQAIAADSQKDALQFLREALKMAQPEGFIRTFMDNGAPMKLLLERLKAEGGDLKDYVLTLLAAIGGESAQDSHAQPLIEAMSERELEILRLMAEGLSNREIAERLVITVGTTKSHVHHILEKTESDSRTQAVAKARTMGLL